MCQTLTLGHPWSLVPTCGRDSEEVPYISTPNHGALYATSNLWTTLEEWKFSRQIPVQCPGGTEWSWMGNTPDYTSSDTTKEYVETKSEDGRNKNNRIHKYYRLLDTRYD